MERFHGARGGCEIWTAASVGEPAVRCGLKLGEPPTVQAAVAARESLSKSHTPPRSMKRSIAHSRWPHSASPVCPPLLRPKNLPRP